MNRSLGYPITVQRGSIPSTLASIATAEAPAHRYAFIIDSTVQQLHGDAISNSASFRDTISATDTLTLTVPPGEHEKNRERWSSLTDALLQSGAGRDTTIIAVGGGVVCDLAGFVAATFMRGIPVVQVPTTLLAMVDASVGGKTGVDTAFGKNLVGAFHNPSAAIVDPDVLATLPAPVFRSGLAEMIKHGVLADADYFDRLVNCLPELAAPNGAKCEELPRLISESIAIKAAVVNEDHTEQGRRATLNFGHTIAHAIEAQSGFGMLHGDAVAIGMIIESDIAERLGEAASGLTSRVRSAVVAAGLPDNIPADLSITDIIATTYGDKKARRGAARYSLPAGIGTMIAAGDRWSVAVPDSVAQAALEAHRA